MCMYGVCVSLHHENLLDCLDWICCSCLRTYFMFSLCNKEGDGSYRFIVKKDAPGLQATKIENKIGLRIVQNGDILLKKVFVPDEERLPGVNSFQDINKVWRLSLWLITLTR